MAPSPVAASQDNHPGPSVSEPQRSGAEEVAEQGDDAWVIPQVVLPALVSILVCTIGMFGYHYFLGKPNTLATVDLQSVFDAKQLEFSEMALRKTATDDDRARALEMAQGFPGEMVKALEKISKACNCTLVVRSAVVGSTKRDYTPELLAEFGLDQAKIEGVKKRLQRQFESTSPADELNALPSRIGR